MAKRATGVGKKSRTHSRKTKRRLAIKDAFLVQKG